jgi:hypothetical protein
MNLALPLHEYILAVLGSAALALLIVRLVASGLARRYKFFFCYLVVDLVQTSAPLFISFRTNLYGTVFVLTESLMLCFYVLIVFELYSVLLRDLKGIATLARWFTMAALGVSIVLPLLLRRTLPRPRYPIEQVFFFEIPIVSSVVLFILLLTLFLAYYPIPLHRNALVYAAGYAAYFLSKAALLFLNNAGSSTWIRACSTAASIVATSSIIFWAVFLNRDGERRTIIAGHRWSSTSAQVHVLKRLHELNESLLRARAR